LIGDDIDVDRCKHSARLPTLHKLAAGLGVEASAVQPHD
jgi:hypothetical protein